MKRDQSGNVQFCCNQCGAVAGMNRSEEEALKQARETARAEKIINEVIADGALSKISVMRLIKQDRNDTLEHS
jgi:DNA-binding TFAR19-related protein (PDSD5 family)